jgi:hypothetical protein
VESTRKSLDVEYDNEYLTQVGLQMSTSCSIAFLYAYNIYCDDFSRKQKYSKGASLLCGDDSIRAGNSIYIETYKLKAIELGSKFSVWKDVTAKNARGVFTEMYLENQEILKIPKIKTLARPDKQNNVPAWLTAVQACNSIHIGVPNRVYLQEEITWKHEQFLKDFGPIFPLHLPEKLGGMGERAPAPDPRLLNIWGRIKAIENRYVGFKYVREYLSPIGVIPERGRILKPNIDPFTWINESFKTDKTGWKVGHSKWLYLEHRRLRGLIESAVALYERPTPPVFPREPGFGAEKFFINRRISEQLKRIVSLNKNLPRKSLPDFPNDQFLLKVYYCDVPLALVDSAKGEG